MKESKDNFLRGNVLKALLNFAFPVLGALVLQAAYGAVDLLVVGRFGDATSISAVGTGSSFMQMVTFIMSSLAMGATVVIAQYIGEGKKKRAGDATGTAIVFFIIVGIVTTVLLQIFIPEIVSLLNVPDVSRKKAITYIRICSGGMIIIIAYNVISSILRGAGNSRLPFIFVCIACAVNVVLDFIFVGTFGMDAAGAAFATIIAQLVSVIASLVMLPRQNLGIEFKKKQCRIYKNVLNMILKIGVPIALQETVVQLSFLVINSIINNMGLMPSAGYGVAQKLISFIMLIPSSIMQSVSALVAQNMGAHQYSRAKKGFKTAMIFGSSVGCIFFLAAFFGGGIMSLVFSNDAAVIAQSAAYLRGFSFECILTCVLFSCIGYFNGCGNSLPVMVQGITSAFLIRIPVSFFMSRLENTSLFYVGLSSPISSAYGIIFFLICFMYQKKKHNEKFA